MRIEGTLTSISWIPSEAVAGLAKMPFSSGIACYDEPPPGALTPAGPNSLEALRTANRFRFANDLRAFVHVDAGRIVDAGYLSGGVVGATTIALGVGRVTVAAVALPDRLSPPEYGDGWVRFSQTAGGRTGVPAPRGLVDFKAWYRHAFGDHTPWGDLDSPALVTEVETALERELSTTVMRGGTQPSIKTFAPNDVLFTQGERGDDLVLVLDGVVSVEHDGVELVHLGPGTVLGERAVLEAGRRTSTTRAVTKVKVAAVRADVFDRGRLAELANGHRRESVLG